MQRRKLFPLLFISAGILLSAASLLRMWQGRQALQPLAPQTGIVAENTEKEETSSSGSTPLSFAEKIIFQKRKLTTKSKEDTKALYPDRPAQGDKIGSLSIPSLKMSLPIYEGTKESELERGVGHYSGSVLPGESDNCVLSGHRDTVFSELQHLEKGDKLLVRTSAGTFTYRIYKIRIVDKEDTTVIVPKPRASLTLTTCYPFTYIGSAPQRYIISAYLI